MKSGPVINDQQALADHYNDLREDAIQDFAVGDFLVIGADSEKGMVSSIYTKQKEIKIKRDGGLRIKFDLKGQAAWPDNHCYGRIYKNGVAVGTERIKAADLDNYTTYSEDIAGLAKDDLVQLYLHNVDDTHLVYCQNFRLYEDVPISAGIALD